MSKLRYVLYVSDVESPDVAAWLQALPAGSRSQQVTDLLAWALASPMLGSIQQQKRTKAVGPVVQPASKPIKPKSANKAKPALVIEHDAKPAQVVAVPESGASHVGIPDRSNTAPGLKQDDPSVLVAANEPPTPSDAEISCLDLMWGLGG